MLKRFTACCVLVALTGNTTTSHAATQEVPDTIAIAYEIGITPESLVLAQLASSQCGGALNALTVIEQVAELKSDIVAARIMIDQNGQAVTNLAESVQVVSDDENLLADFAQALDDLNASKVAHASAKGTLLDEVLYEVPSAAVTALAIWRDSSHRNVPSEFRVLNLSDQQWNAIERALRAEKRAIRVGETLAAEHAQVLADVRSDVAVVNAQYALTSHLAAVETVFEQFSNQ